MFIPVPPKMCMSICSSRHITKVLTWGSNPKRKITGKHKANTVGQNENKSSYFSWIEYRHYRCVESLVNRLTNEHIPDTEQEVCREEGYSIEGEGLQAARASRQVENPDHHTAQAEVDRPTVHNNPVMALLNNRDKSKLQNNSRTNKAILVML